MMTPIDWAGAIKYASLVAIAEEVAPSAEYSPEDIEKIESLGYAFLETIYGDDLATDVDPHLGDVVTFGFLATGNGGEMVAALRGTDTLLEWLHDGSFLMVKGPEGLTEDGFTAVYRSLRLERQVSNTGVPSILDCIASPSTQKLTVCGHSLGGALATLLAYDARSLPPDVFTFASPRVGDHQFVGAYNKAILNSYRVANRQDLIPKLPPVFPLPYEHVATEYELSPPIGKIKSTIPCQHHLSTYLWLISQVMGGTQALIPACVATGEADTI